MKEEALNNTLGRIGSKLTYLRKKKGYTSHEDFAHDYELPRVQYWRIEKGKANITIKSLCKLLTIHGLSVEEFFYHMYKEYKESKEYKEEKDKTGSNDNREAAQNKETKES